MNSSSPKAGTVIILLTAITGIISWPLLLLEGKTWPETSCLAMLDAWERIYYALAHDIWRLFHDLKNLGTEAFRCDAQWWFKFTSFTWVGGSLLVVALVAYVIVLLIRNRRLRR